MAGITKEVFDKMNDCPDKTTSAKHTVETIAATIAERGNSHGRFTDNGEIMQGLKNQMRAFVRKPQPWDKSEVVVFGEDPLVHAFDCLSAHQAEALDMICHKIGRILCGDPNFRDHWHDIAGYATLCRDLCEK